MGKIHFKDDVKVATWKAIEEAHDCADVATDLLRIQNTIVYGTDEEAMRLDLELWKKYPIINAMLQIANSLPVQPSQCAAAAAGESPSKANLRQDYYGILCHIAVKKGIKKSIEDCIDYIEFFSIMQTKNVRMKWSAANNGVHRSQGSSTI